MMTQDPMRLTSPTMEEDHLRSGLSGKTNYSRPQIFFISTGPLQYTFTEGLLAGDAKAIFHQAALDIGIYNVNNFNKVLTEMTKHTFPVYAFVNKRGTYLGTQLNLGA